MRINVYINKRIKEALDDKENKSQFIRQAVEFYLDYHDKQKDILEKNNAILEKIERNLGSNLGSSETKPVKPKEPEENSRSLAIDNILNMGGVDD